MEVLYLGRAAYMCKYSRVFVMNKHTISNTESKRSKSIYQRVILFNIAFQT